MRLLKALFKDLSRSAINTEIIKRECARILSKTGGILSEIYKNIDVTLSKEYAWIELAVSYKGCTRTMEFDDCMLLESIDRFSEMYLKPAMENVA